MIPSRIQFYPETIISERRINKTEDILSGLSKKYTRLLDEILKPFHEVEGSIPLRLANTREWIRLIHPRGQVIEVLFPRESPSSVFILELLPMRSLNTKWAERYKSKPSAYLSITGFGNIKNSNNQFTDFSEFLGEVIKEKFGLKNPPDMVNISPGNDVFSKLKDLPQNNIDIPTELEPSLKMMKDPSFRNTIIRTKQAKDPTLENVSKSSGISKRNVKKYLEYGMKNNVVNKQLNVLCPSCSNTLARVEDKEALVGMEKNKVECPNCKTKVNSDSYSDSYFISNDFGSLIEGSKWMELLICWELDEHITPSQTLLGVQDGPNELDIMSLIGEATLLAELKDSRFSIGHAYSFVGKCSQYRPDISLIVATEGIDDDVKEYIENTGIDTEYISDIQNLSPRIDEILSAQNARSLEQLLSDIPWNTLISKAVLSEMGEEAISSIDTRRAYRFRSRRRDLY